MDAMKLLLEHFCGQGSGARHDAGRTRHDTAQRVTRAGSRAPAALAFQRHYWRRAGAIRQSPRQVSGSASRQRRGKCSNASSKKRCARLRSLLSSARIKSGDKIPDVEQIVSAGAAAEHIMLAAQALAYGAMWRTGAPAYDERVKELRTPGRRSDHWLYYIGTSAVVPPEVPRPELDDFVTRWRD